jgi:hypothetical protein
VSVHAPQSGHKPVCAEHGWQWFHYRNAPTGMGVVPGVPDGHFVALPGIQTEEVVG